ncbi:MAG: FkbM family methyltransferase [Anaerolineaceae bacterium]
MKNRFTYYWQSLITLLKGVKNIGALLTLATRQPDEKPVKLNLKTGESFFVSTLMDAWIVKETVLDRQYEAASVPLQSDWLVIDVGAALGDYAIWAARQLITGKVIAVEPYPLSVKLLHENMLLNQTNDIEVVETAVGGKDGQMELQLVTGQSVQHSTADSRAAAGSLTVKVRSLTSLLIAMKIDAVDYLKMDCEGAEFDILFNCSPEVLNRIKRICMEIHDGVTIHSHEEMIEFLERNGYKTRLTPNPVHANLAYLYAER